jgi:transposase-like protein
MFTVKNLKELIQNFSDEQKCIDFLVQMRWNGSPVCPYCKCEKWYRIENGKRFKCGNKECHKKYSVTVNSIFHASNIPLTTWFPAVYLISSHKKGISSCQLAKDLGVCQKTAWFMIHRIREALKNKGSFFLKNTVEIDEMYAGSKIKNMSNTKRKEFHESMKGTHANKTMIMGMIERGGELRLQVAGDEDAKSKIIPIVFDNVDKSAILMTDGEGTYKMIGKHYSRHETVNHAVNEYVREGGITTNTIEGAFGLFRRSIIGIYHKISPKHLQRYCDEMTYRYNLREMKEGERFEYTLGRLEGKLSWKELTKDNGATAETIIEPELPPIKLRLQGKKAPIRQMLNGVEIARFPSIKAASVATGICASSIGHAVRGERKSVQGYQWKFL